MEVIKPFATLQNKLLIKPDHVRWIIYQYYKWARR